MNIHKLRYNKFIESRKDRTINDNDLVEKHHIIPRSLGGEDLSENIIVLTLREHFIAHLLLWKGYGGAMATAFFMMAHFSKNNESRKKGNPPNQRANREKKQIITRTFVFRGNKK
jgi:hypothetical protein